MIQVAKTFFFFCDALRLTLAQHFHFFQPMEEKKRSEQPFSTMLLEMELLHLEACQALPAAKITSCGSHGGTELLQGHSAGRPRRRRKLWPLAEGPRHCEALSHCCHWLAMSL